jgi:hypothetical protein
MIGNTSIDDQKRMLWTPEALAGFLGVPVGWVYKRTRKNGPDKIPHIKLGKYVRFNPESKLFQQWLEKHSVEGEIASDDPHIPIAGN